MPVQIYPGDLVFPIDGSNAYQEGSTTVSPTVDMATSFASRARPTKDLIAYSIIADLVDDQGPTGVLSLWVTNACFTTRGDGSILFNGPVSWVQKPQSVINVGAAGITAPFDISMPFNAYSAMQLRYQASGGGGTFRAKLGGVGV